MDTEHFYVESRAYCAYCRKEIKPQEEWGGNHDRDLLGYIYKCSCPGATREKQVNEENLSDDMKVTNAKHLRHLELQSLIDTKANERFTLDIKIQKHREHLNSLLKERKKYE